MRLAGEDALADALDVRLHDQEELQQEIIDNKIKRGSRTTIQRYNMQIDAVGMLWERREIARLAEHPEEVQSMHLFSDGSPVTRGAELQGQILQIALATGIIWEIIMPGYALWFGMNRVVDKVCGFLWALHLLTGPSEKLCASCSAIFEV